MHMRSPTGLTSGHQSLETWRFLTLNNYNPSDCHGTDTPVRLHIILIFCGVSNYEADCDGRSPFNTQVENLSAPPPAALLRQLYFQMQSTLDPSAATQQLVWFS